MSAPGESGDAEFEVAVGVVDLSGTTAGMDVECDDLELHGVTGATKDAKIGLPLLAGAWAGVVRS